MRGWRQLDQQLLDYQLTDPEWDDRFCGFKPELDMDKYRAAMYCLAYAQLPETPPSPEETVMANEARQLLYIALESLEPREYDLLISRYGLRGEPQKRPAWLSYDRVRSLEARALCKLRRPRWLQPLKEAWDGLY